MESDECGEDENMATIQRQTRQCRGDADVVYSSKKRTSSSWSTAAWIWRLSNAAMVVFFATAAYVQVGTAQ